MTILFELRGTKYPLNITYYQAIKDLPEKCGISLTKIFTDGDAAANTMQALILDDEKTLDLMWFFIEEKTDMTFDDLLQIITGKDLERFREDFWSAVVNFSGPLKKNLLIEMWSQFKRDIKKAELTSVISDASLSDSKDEEST